MKTPEQMRDDSTLAFLASYASRSKEPIKPTFRHGTGVVYEIERADLSFERVRSYEKEKLLSVVSTTPFPACPRCESLLLSIQLNCPDCKKQSLTRSELIIHYGCEYSGPVEEFVSRKDAEYVCPKCSKTLKRVGIEYGKPGIGFKCCDCGRVFQYPLVNIICSNSHVLKLDELDMKSFPVYRVNEEIQGFADLAGYFFAIQKALIGLSVEPEVLARLRGQSGVVHIIPLVVKTDKIHAAIDFILSESGSDAKVLQKIMRSADLSQFVALLFVPASLVDKLSDMVNPEKIKLLAIPGDDPDAVAREVAKIVR